MNGHKLTAGERLAYNKGAARAATTYLKKHGYRAASLPSGDTSTARRKATMVAHFAAWDAEHADAYAAAQHAGGVRAVKRHLAKSATMLAAHDGLIGKPGYVADAAWTARRAVLAADVARDAARADALGLSATRRKSTAKPAKPARVKPAPAAAKPAPVETVTVPDTAAGLPTAPRMTRAARKASNRELASRMRAAGVAITPDTWAAAKAGTLTDINA